MSVELKHVSKQYRLGASNVSLREAVPNLLQRVLRREASDNSKDKMLWALKDVSFKLERGQALGIIGPNGAGKTTILKLLSKITQPAQGEIHVDGRVSALIELGAGFHPDLTGRENLFLNAAILGLSRHEMAARYDQIVEFSGLQDFMGTPVKRYSSGMYVRLGFSVAAHVDPDILLVDEVLAVGDASFRQKCIERIHLLRKRGTTIVFVSHGMPLVRSVCDKGLFLLNGQVKVFGPTLDAIRAYETYLRTRDVQEAVRINQTFLAAEAGEGPIDILGIDLLDSNLQPSERFSYADNLQVCVRYRARDLIRSPGIEARIMRSDGTTCCEIRSSNDGVWLPDLQSTGHVSFFLEPVQLASGAYVMEIRFKDTTDAADLATGHSGWFQVSGPGATVLHEYAGVYVPQVRWEPAGHGQSVERNGSRQGVDATAGEGHDLAAVRPDFGEAE